MEIRKLTEDELLEANLISVYCFHFRADSLEEVKKRADEFGERIDENKKDDWGAFAEDGTLMARIINNKYRFYLDGSPVTAGGIGAVSTRPEYREAGAIKNIFQEIFANAYENGEVISALYPFNHAFYRKQGYETVLHQNRYELAPALLRHYKFDGTVKRWNPGESVKEFLDVYLEFAKDYNFTVPRDEEYMLNHMKVKDLYIDRKFSYILKKDGKAIAYLIFTDVKEDAGAMLRVDECAWTCRDGFHAILAFLGRFTADYEKILLPLPTGIDLLKIIQTPGQYEIKKECAQNFMVRVINAEKLLAAITKPAGCDFIIQVADEKIMQNNGIWHVTEKEVLKTEEAADITVDVRALGQMATGSISFDEAQLRKDVEVHTKDAMKLDMLGRVFKEKKIFVSEQF